MHVMVTNRQQSPSTVTSIAEMRISNVLTVSDIRIIFAQFLGKSIVFSS